MVTHDANAASYADHVVFLKDGKVVSEMHSPTADAIVARLLALETQPGVATAPSEPNGQAD
jgi:putative ABC transport system ATP-binding protein